MDACMNPGILRVIYFIKILLDVIFIIAPIGLIVMGSIDFSKSVITSEEKEGKKNTKLFFKRIVFAILLFAVPWMVRTFMHLLGDLTTEESFITCYEKASKDGIAEADKQYQTEEENRISKKKYQH